MRYPPAVALVNVVVKAPTLQAAMDDAGEHRAARCAAGGRPYRCSARRRRRSAACKGEHRAQFFLKGAQRDAMRKALLTVLDGAAGDQAADDRGRGSDERAVVEALSGAPSNAELDCQC